MNPDNTLARNGMGMKNGKLSDGDSGGPDICGRTADIYSAVDAQDDLKRRELFGEQYLSIAYVGEIRPKKILDMSEQLELGKRLAPMIELRKEIKDIQRMLRENLGKRRSLKKMDREMLIKRLIFRLRLIACAKREVLLLPDFERARNTLVEHNLRWVIKIARKYTELGLPFKDLVQEGNIGLMMAAERYEWQLNLRFTTYATWWIRQRILRSINDYGDTVRLPSYIHELLPSLMSLRESYVAEHGKEPSYAQLAYLSGHNATTVENVLTAGNKIISLERRDGRDDFNDDSYPASTDTGMLPFEGTALANLKRILGKMMMEKLTPREIDVVLRRSGTGKYTGASSLQEVGDAHGLSRERIRQIEREAFRKLRRGPDSLLLREFL